MPLALTMNQYKLITINTMKHLILRNLMLIAVLLTGSHAFAYDFEVEGIYYNITDETNKTVEVTFKEAYSNEYTGTVVIPTSVERTDGTVYTVISIGSGAFYGCTGLTSIVIPNSVTTIGDEAFSYCTGLIDVSIGNSVITIGSNVFYNTGWYNKQTDGILYLNNWCLGYKGDVPTGTLSIKEGTRLIAGKTFYGCTDLTSIVIPNSVITIGSGAFSYCTGLTSIVIPNSVTTIGNETFWGCAGLTNIVIPDSVTSIGSSAFAACTSLTSVSIGNSVTTIGRDAFSGCTGLTSVTIGDSVTTIGGGAFYQCAGLTSIVIPNSVTTIGDYAFYDCFDLTSVSIGNSVTTICDYAFYGCSGLTSITIPNSVTSIGYDAFYECTGLTKIYCKATNPPACEAYYDDSYQVCSDESLQNATLYVPTGCKTAYESVDPWRNFWNIVETDFSGVEETLVDEEGEPAEYYNLQGVKVAYPENGIFIKKQGSRTTKIVL